MTNQWQAEYVINKQIALNIIGKQFSELHVTSIELLGAGWDNTAYIINNEFVFRFPRREVAVALLHHEIVALPIIVDQVTILVPNPQWQGKSTEDYPYSFLGYKMLPGVTADSVDMSDIQRMQLAPAIGQFLSQLHAIIPTEECLSVLPKNIILERLGLDYLIPAVKSNLEKVVTLESLEFKDQLYHLLGSSDLLRVPTNKTLVHGDLYCRHLLLDKALKLSGIIDWGDVQIGDPAIDLAIAHSFLPPSAHKAFKTSYGFVSEETWNLARFRALHHSLLLIVYGHDVGDFILVREGKKALSYIAEQV